jgi:hypothetical protein
VNQADLIAWHRSTAMARAGEKVSVDRDDLLDVLAELVAARALIARAGGGLADLAREARRISS